MKDFLSHFGFHTVPFTRELEVENRFSLPFLEEAAQALTRAIHNRMSAALIAPAGTGKTVVIRALMQGLPEARYRAHYLKVTDVSKRDLCREIALCFGCEPAGTYPALVRRLQERFASATTQAGLRPVLILDEAHDLKPDVLGILRVLTNFEMDRKLVLSILLVGQRPLRSLLLRDTMDATRTRLAHVAELRLLSREESRRYLLHRCTVAGASTAPFDDKEVDAIYEITRGNLRAMDGLAHLSLESAYLAGAPVVDSNHVIQARRGLLT